MEGNPDTFFLRFLEGEVMPDTLPRAGGWDGLRSSVFSGHELQPEDSYMPVHQNTAAYQPQPWLFGVFVIQLLILAGIMGFFRNGFIRQITALVSVKNLDALAKEGNIVYQIHTVLLLFIYVLSMGGAATVAAGRFFPEAEYSPLQVFIAASVLTAALFFAKFVLFGLLGRVSGESLNNRRYITNMVVFNGLVGLLVLPVAFVGAYQGIPYMFVLLLVAVTGIYIVRAVRGVWVVQSNSPFPALYIILYLCTLEIMPVLMVLAWGLNA